jgi:hypothetical protein
MSIKKKLEDAKVSLYLMGHDTHNYLQVM